MRQGMRWNVGLAVGKEKLRSGGIRRRLMWEGMLGKLVIGCNLCGIGRARVEEGPVKGSSNRGATNRGLALWR